MIRLKAVVNDGKKKHPYGSEVNLSAQVEANLIGQGLAVKVEPRKGGSGGESRAASDDQSEAKDSKK